MMGFQPLSDLEKARYARHLVLDGVGEAGQQKLKAAQVLVIGLGGLGAPAAMYLAAAGVGVIGLADADTVSLSNLQRQIIYTTADIGEPKVEIAAARLRAMNPHVEINLHPVEITAENAMNIFADYDFVLDGTDNFAAHYLINDAAVISNKPLVWGNVERFAGQVGVVLPSVTACYRCLYPSAPPAGIAPNCAEIGVLGAVPGAIGSLQAMEMLKLILGIGTHDKITRMGGADFNFLAIQTARDPHCAVCGKMPSITKLETHERLCMIQDISPDKLREKLQSSTPPFLLDVRNPDEFEQASIEGAYLIPLPTLETRMGELDPQREIVVYCAAGKRSARAIEILANHGFQHLSNLEGGIIAMQQSAA